jgi:branched-chain amino acid transport system permease protein
MVIIYLLIERAIRSPWGRVLRAIREDEVSAAMSGKDIFKFKMQSFIFGSMVMGVGGALFAHYMKAVSPDIFTPLYGTFLIWVMLIAGGSGNNKGAILGAYVIWGIWIGTQLLTDFLPYTLKARAPYIRFLVIWILLEIILIYRPQGILGEEKKVSRMLE